jgi:hypothetical protein
MAKKVNELKKIVRFKNGVNPKVMEFVLAQTNFSEAITYLIEKELYENGSRDLMKFIPMIRSNEYFESQPQHEPVKELEADEPVEVKSEPVKVEKVKDEPKNDGVLDSCFDD